MPMEAGKNSALRFTLWDVFRSASRDHMVPAAAPGRTLQRIRIQSAYPVRGVEEGVLAVSIEDRTAIEASQTERRRSLPQAEDIPLGLMKYFPCQIRNSVATPNGVNTDEEFRVITVPYDGYIKEFIANRNGSDAGGQMLAIRSSSGGTLFSSFWLPRTAFPLISSEPDFINFDDFGTGAYNTELRGGHIPVYAGDVITAVLRNTIGHAAEGSRLFFTIGIEQVILGSAGSRAAASAFSSTAAYQARANREAAAAAARLAIERERTARTKMEIDARLKLAEQAQTLTKVKATLPPPPPPPPFGNSSPLAPTGEGKTFVASWLPNENSIGYLIPTPPRGGKVNTFGDTYTVWDMFGKMVEQGKIELVRSEAEIPPAARLSPNIRTTPSVDIRASQQQILASRAGESAFGQ